MFIYFSYKRTLLLITFNNKSFSLFRTIANGRQYITGWPMYVWSHIRASPYLVGLLAGYILSVYKPSNYRNVISTVE